MLLSDKGCKMYICSSFYDIKPIIILWQHISKSCLMWITWRSSACLPSSSLVMVTVTISLAPTMAPLQWSLSGVPRCTWNNSSGSNTESSMMWTVQFFTWKMHNRSTLMSRVWEQGHKHQVTFWLNILPSLLWGKWCATHLHSFSPQSRPSPWRTWSGWNSAPMTWRRGRRSGWWGCGEGYPSPSRCRSSSQTAC